ncbi:NAD-dependent dehydratase [Pseudomonas sp. FW300-N1A1]|uniref:UDP-glucose 4-epimerase family protein n=1 Tax=Pseudomonas sp. FW300-N1A1 TaxID=2075555 RepID=UPI000CD2426A|nr:SDR family oxidoreductase [Pseudomonas sp. FW300-N1A1]POA21773.1 NAD-dependent dehydratase [Pseudomonas sp. FW300-N1A1]
MNGPKVLVTGASGFVGEAVVFRLLLDGKFTPVAAVRNFSRLVEHCQVVPFSLGEDVLLPPLNDIQVIIHCAARVHVMHEVGVDALAEFRKVNVDGTVQLARKAAEAGVKRFIYISSIKVNGESSVQGSPFRFDDIPAPIDPYGISKREAEIALQQVSLDTGMEVVIIRPPLVYGPGVGANFLSMMVWLNKGVPLPLGAINNRRSFVAVDNLADLIVKCVDHPEAANNTFLVSDGDDLSTTQLLKRIGAAFERPALLIPVPVRVLKFFLCVVGKKVIAQRLLESLEVDIVRTQTLLDWNPPVGVDFALRQTVDHYLDAQKK